MRTVRLTIIPKSKKNSVTPMSEGRYEVKLKAEPEHNEANVLLINVLAEYFEVSPTTLSIVSGHHSRHKRVEIK